MSLTQLSYYVRRSLPYFAVVMFVLGVFYVGFLYLNSQQYKQGQIVLEPIFGPIQRPTIENKLPYPQNPNFTLDNIEGKPLTATSAGQVFFVPKPKTRFGYLETVFLMAKSLDFDTNIDQYNLSGKMASFSGQNKTLSIDITNFNFEFEQDYNLTPNFFENPVMPDEESATQDARGFLDKIGRYPEDLKKGTVNVIYLSHTEGKKDFVVVNNIREADVVEVDFFRPEVDEHPMVAPRYFNSQNFVVIAYPNGKPEIIKAQIRHFEKDTATVGSYPLVTGDEAWSQFIAGKGKIIANQNPGPSIRITDMYLGYLDLEDYQEFIQPIYVFLGENNFVGWIEALSPEYLK